MRHPAPRRSGPRAAAGALGVALLAGAAVTLPATPASAMALTHKEFLVAGSGTISPPATAIPRPSFVTFTGTAVLLGTPQACAMSGPAAFESMEAGAGVLSGSCGTVPMSCLYERAGVAMTWQCTTVTFGVLSGTFLYRPANVNPTTVFDLAGVLAGVTMV